MIGGNFCVLFELINFAFGLLNVILSIIEMFIHEFLFDTYITISLNFNEFFYFP